MNPLLNDFKILKWKFSLATLIWFALAAMGATLKIRLGYDKIGNFLIFRNAFWHMVHQTSLYSYYASEKLGSYLYGPSFSIVIAPFSFLAVNDSSSKNLRYSSNIIQFKRSLTGLKICLQ